MIKIKPNSEILDALIEKSGCENPNQFASYLSDKYGVPVSRQQVNQFKNAEGKTLVHLLLREAQEE